MSWGTPWAAVSASPAPRCPFAYAHFAAHRVSVRTLLPFALVGDLHYMTPFVSVFISTFLSWDSLAEELEDPFGTAANDLPLNAM